MATERDIRPTLQVKTPKVPNFLRTAVGDFPIPIRTVSEEDLRAIGAAWTEALVQRAWKQRAKEASDV